MNLWRSSILDSINAKKSIAFCRGKVELNSGELVSDRNPLDEIMLS